MYSSDAQGFNIVTKSVGVLGEPIWIFNFFLSGLTKPTLVLS